MSANRIRATETVRNWNIQFRPGQVVIFLGKKAKTWGPAGLGWKDVPSVFLDLPEVPEPVPLDRPDVPGCHVTIGKKRTNERPSKG